jgi:hypothetical protein
VIALTGERNRAAHGAMLHGEPQDPFLLWTGLSTGPVMSRFRIVAGVLLALSPPAGAAAQSCAPGALSLEARAVQALPATFGIEGVATAPEGRLALWSVGGEILELDRERGAIRHHLPDSIVPIGLGIVAEGYRILDNRTGREILLTLGDSLSWLGPIALHQGDMVDRAVWRDDHWLLLVRSAASREFELRIAGTERSLYRSAPADSLRTIPRYHLSEGAGPLLLTRYTSPFDIIRIDPASGRTDTLAPLIPQRLDIPPDSLTHWRALPTVAIDCGMLLTLSDLTSDRRLLVRYSAAGGIDRITPLDAPLGLVARLPGEQTVLAARRTGDLELVWYDWHWAREPVASQ